MGCMHGYVFLASSNVPNALQICVRVHEHPVMDTPGAVQEKVLMSPSPVTGDTVLLVPVGCSVTHQEGFGQE